VPRLQRADHPATSRSPRPADASAAATAPPGPGNCSATVRGRGATATGGRDEITELQVAEAVVGKTAPSTVRHTKLKVGTGPRAGDQQHRARLRTRSASRRASCGDMPRATAGPSTTRSNPSINAESEPFQLDAQLGGSCHPDVGHAGDYCPRSFPGRFGEQREDQSGRPTTWTLNQTCGR
jgi:hypothetical protein